LPNSDLTSAETRPALIVQADDLQTGLAQIIVAMITSQMFRAGHPSRVTILLISPEAIVLKVKLFPALSFELCNTNS